jgi:hypothetical protein
MAEAQTGFIFYHLSETAFVFFFCIFDLLFNIKSIHDLIFLFNIVLAHAFVYLFAAPRILLSADAGHQIV